jgi:hypothetical protein
MKLILTILAIIFMCLALGCQFVFHQEELTNIFLWIAVLCSLFKDEFER